MEGDRNRKKVMEPYGSLWKMREQSIGKLCKQGDIGLELTMKRGGRD